MLVVEDRRLLDGYRRGDRKALELLYGAYAPEVARVLRYGFTFDSQGRTCRFRGVCSEFDLEDRLQEVFARAFSESARTNYDGITPFGSYLTKIAKNLIIDQFRKKEQSLLEFSVEPAATTPDEREGASEPLQGRAEATGRPEHDRDRAQLVELVLAFRDQLPDRERVIYELRFEQELQHKEVARAVGLSESQVKTSEQRIRMGFYRFMRKHGYFSGYVQERRGWLRPLRSS
jgi:RNA polymerase sigma-70 factor (ECF subfamily)